jgi:predicted O-linked N-acetylglucosamine transferase (SPINDLY family)
VAQDNLRREAQSRGIDPERLINAPHAEMDMHIARHRLAGLFLDTLDYNAHSTASDALWAGLPMLTLPGATFASRVASSLAKAAGTPETVVASLQDYEDLAVALAQDETRLAALKQKLVEGRDTCALFDTQRFTRNIETAYRTMIERARKGENPAPMVVQGLD